MLRRKALLLIVVVILFQAGCGPAPTPSECADGIGCVEVGPDEPIKIGAIQNLSGEGPPGLFMVHCVELALDSRSGRLRWRFKAGGPAASSSAVSGGMVYIGTSTGQGPDDGYLYFLDDNFHPRHETEDGIWTRDRRRAEIILKTYFPVRTILVHLLNNPRRENDITVRVENQTQKVRLEEKQRADLEFKPGKGFVIRDFFEVVIFIGILSLAIVYAWRKGVFNWQIRR